LGNFRGTKFLGSFIPPTFNHSRLLSFLILLLPGLNYWTSALGKDSLSFMAVGLICWSAISLHSRWLVFIASSIILTIIRPHIGVILFASFPLPLAFSLNLSYCKKFLILIASISLIFLSLFAAFDYIGFSETPGFHQVTSYFNSRMSANLEGATSFDLESMSQPIRFFSYLFRPLYFDIDGPLGLIVSFENSLLLLLLSCSLLFASLGKKSSLPAFSFTFFLSYSFLSLYVLSNTTANLGIAIRQKWLFLPMIILISLSTLFKSRQRL